jgi:hypothetical protein
MIVNEEMINTGPVGRVEGSGRQGSPNEHP